MITFSFYILVVSTLAAFILTLARKWGIIEHMQVYGNDFFSRMANCNFCLSWWACVIVSVYLAILTGDAKSLFVPFFATSITRILL